MANRRGRTFFFALTVQLVRLGLAGGALLVPATARARAAPPQSPSPPGTRGPAVRELFTQHCAKCHGNDGTGKQARVLQPDIPDFTAATWQGRRNDAQLRVSILDGKGKDMPPFSGKINEAQARDLVSHVRAFAPVPAKEGAAKPERPSASKDPEEEIRRLQREIDELKKQRDGRQSSNPDLPKTSEDTSESPETKPPNSFAMLIEWFGRYHPAAVHFPIALLSAAAIAEVLHLATSRRSYAAVSRFCVRFGALAAAGAGILGWFAGDFRLSDASWVMTAHRWLGTCTVACAGLVLTLSELCRKADRRRTRACFRATLFSCALLALTTGFFGGAVVNGIDHYAWPQ
jgi:mono/diheme cytochrome c family protein/uncharacterized membrane protein